MDKLFEIETYEGCRITWPDQDTFVVEGAEGYFVKLRFRKVITDWNVELDVDVSVPLMNAEWYALVRGQAGTAAVIRFWSKIRRLCLSQSLESRDKTILAANKMLEASP